MASWLSLVDLNVWLNNANEILSKGIADIRDIISSRDDVFDKCLQYGINRETAFSIATDVRRGNGISKNDEMVMLNNGIPQWYVDSCNKIKYLFPRAHIISYVLQAWRVAYFKVYYPEDFYLAYFDAMALKESIEIIRQGYDQIEQALEELSASEYTDKTHNMICDLEVAEEMYDCGFSVI